MHFLEERGLPALRALPAFFEKRGPAAPGLSRPSPFKGGAGRIPGLPPVFVHGRLRPDQVRASAEKRRADRAIPLDPAAGLDSRTPAHWRGPRRVAAAQPGLERRKPMKTDLYQRVTDQIVASLEQGVRPWMKPWNAEHAAGRITRPLRANGIAYQGINVLVLWGESVTKGYSAPIWMTFRQALELDAHVRKGERGSTVVYASTITRSGTDQETGEDCQETIPFLKSYTVFNVEQIEGLPAHFHAVAEPRLDPVQRIERAEEFLCQHKSRHPPRRQHGLLQYRLRLRADAARSRRSAMPKAITPRWRMNAPTGRGTNPGSTAISGARSGAMPGTPWRNWSQSLAALSSAPIST